MATITSNVTVNPTNTSISGTTSKTITLSWSLPSLPANAVVSSRVLQVTPKLTMSRGSATITSGGTTLTSDVQSNLTQSNTATSVTITARGGNKNATGTLTFTAIYVVTYTVPLPTYTVRFLDWNGTVLSTQTIEEGSNATPPSNPSRPGYTFIGWLGSCTNITSNRDITAQYEEVPLIKKIYSNDDNINNLYIGDTKILKVYIGNDIIYEG